MTKVKVVFSSSYSKITRVQKWQLSLIQQALFMFIFNFIQLIENHLDHLESTTFEQKSSILSETSISIWNSAIAYGSKH